MSPKDVSNSLSAREKAELLYDLTRDEEVVFSLPKNKMVYANKAIADARKRKYKRNRKKKHDDGDRVIPREHAMKILESFYPEEYRIQMFCYLLGCTGFRLSEALKLKVEDVNFEERWIRVHRLKKKSKRIDYFPMHDLLFDPLFDYVQKYEKEFPKFENYLFFRYPHGQRGPPHFTGAHAYRVFRKIVDRIGLDRVYESREALSKKTLNCKTINGQLHYYCLHSWRHSFGHYLAQNDIPIERAKRALCHDSIATTDIYYTPTKEQVDRDIHRVFNRNYRPSLNSKPIWKV